MDAHLHFDRVEAGRRLCHDLFKYRRPLATEQALGNICEGFAEARIRNVPAHPADRFVRKWLQLRLNAYRRGRSIADDVTPAMLSRIDLAACPVTRVPLTHGALLDSDWSIDRLNNDGAYARNNLAVMSTRANRAKGDLRFEQVHARALRDDPTDGLAPCEWLRLAALMLGPCFVLEPAAAPLIPLTAPLPQHAAHPAAQQIQHLLTTTAARPAGKNLLIKSLSRACHDERSRHRLQQLADAVHAGLKRVAVCHDVWLQPGVMAACIEWREALGERGWAMAGALACELSGGRRVPEHRLAAWHLPTRGYAC